MTDISPSPRTAKQLIVNADDLGLSPGINEGILETVANGCVRSATALAGGPAFKEGLNRIAALGRVSVGIHLNLTGSWDRPRRDTAPGFFQGEPGPLLKACLTGRADLSFAEACLRRQIEAFLDTGAVPTHLDGHHHVQVFPGIASLVTRLAGEYRIRRCRLPLEPFQGVRAGGGSLLKRTVIRFLTGRAAARFGKAGMISPDRFFGFGLMNRADYKKRLLRILSGLTPGVTEIMVHPGRVDPGFDLDSYRSGRRVEVAALTSPEIAGGVKAMNIELVSYDVLP